MLLFKLGSTQFLAEEKKHLHYDLNRLSDFIIELTEKDRAILICLSHFVRWAGRYPDPGARNLESAVDVFKISEQYEIAAKDLFELSSRVMKHTRLAID